MKFRVGTYNVENLFRRARILNLRDEQRSSELLALVRQLQGLIDRKTYSDATRSEIFEVSAELIQYVDMRVDMGSFGEWRKRKDGNKTVTGWRVFKNCRGRGDWIGQIIFRDDDFSDVQRQNTARVLKDVAADAQCLIEVEGMDALRMFNSDALKRRFTQYVVIDSPNDPRHIDVGFLSTRPMRSIHTHIFDTGSDKKPIFSRDCLRVTTEAANGKVLHFLCNHFKSQRGRSEAEQKASAARRKAQATRVSKIVTSEYNLSKDFVVIFGDLNEDTSSGHQSLAPLLETAKLVPIVDPGKDRNERWTYHYDGAKKGERLSQLDYIFVSKALQSRLKDTGFERRGIFDVEAITVAEGAKKVTGYSSVTAWNESASDHAALWADFEL